ncbi:hypothetical protein PMI17_04393, partial [Pantoea sp. GM01]
MVTGTMSPEICAATQASAATAA